MKVKLLLKKRGEALSVSVGLESLKAFLDQEDKEGLFEFIANFKDPVPSIHDKTWLKMLVNWVPQGGVLMTEAFKWQKLAEKVEGIDEEKTKAIFLTEFQINLLWERMQSDEIKLVRFSPPLMNFLFDFCKTTGKNFPQTDPEEDEQKAPPEKEK